MRCTMTIEDPSLRLATGSHKRYVETPTGIRIGSLYMPPHKPSSTDAETLQSALLDPLTAKPLPFLARLYRRIAHWL
jgi:hypothetical protein